MLATITAVMVLAQPVLAGIYLDGNVRAIVAHGTNAHLMYLPMFAQLIAALLYRTVGRGKGWPLHATAVLLFVGGMQIGFGYGSFLAAHVPLGIAILACQLGITIWLWTPAAARPRPHRNRRTHDQHDNSEQERGHG